MHTCARRVIEIRFFFKQAQDFAKKWFRWRESQQFDIKRVVPIAKADMI